MCVCISVRVDVCVCYCAFDCVRTCVCVYVRAHDVLMLTPASPPGGREREREREWGGVGEMIH